MKKFFTIIPLQTPSRLHYEAVGNTRLQVEDTVQFPILTAIAGYTQPGDSIRVIAIVTNNPAGRQNLETFRGEIASLCEKKGITCPRGVEDVMIESDDRVAAHVATFQRLIDYVEDDDELFACMTYGTKPTSTAMMMAVQYAYRVKKNASISCILYGQVDRPNPKDPATWRGRVYDMTALVQLDEIVHLLAERGDPDPKKTIDCLLAL